MRWRRLAVNLVGTGIRDCSNAADSSDCYSNPFIRFNLTQAGPAWQSSYSGQWHPYDIATAKIEAGKALTAEEWLEPVTNSWNMAYVSNVARGEFYGRPMAGNYDLTFDITPDVRLDRIERVQLLVEEDYWIRQGNSVDANSGAGGSTGTGGATSTGGSTGSGGTTGTGGTTSAPLTGSCVSDHSNQLIDDFEDGNNQIATAENRLGFWSTVNLSQCSTATFAVASGQGNPIYGSYGAVESGSGCASSVRGGGIGFTFAASQSNGVTTNCSAYDAHLDSGIVFDIKGTGTGRVEVCSADVDDGNCHGYDITLSSTWTNYSLTWSQLAQSAGWGALIGPLNPSRLVSIQFFGKGTSYSFTIDNVKFRP